jgi:hypothetical protein
VEFDARNPEFNVLNWWSLKESEFGAIAKVARKYLAIQASSAASERVFSDAAQVGGRKRWSLKHARLENGVLCRLNSQYCEY